MPLPDRFIGQHGGVAFSELPADFWRRVSNQQLIVFGVYRIYVEVDVTHKTDGTARPRKIKFEDGEVYEIDRVRHCCRAASTKVGGTGL